MCIDSYRLNPDIVKKLFFAGLKNLSKEWKFSPKVAKNFFLEGKTFLYVKETKILGGIVSKTALQINKKVLSGKNSNLRL